MNVSELARKLKVNPQDLREMLPQMGFHVGAKAIKIDDRTATRIMAEWKHLLKKWESQYKKQEEKEDQAVITTEEKKQQVQVGKLIIVKEFAAKINTPVNVLIKVLMKNGILASLNDRIDFESASIIGDDLGWEVVSQEEGAVEVESNSKELIDKAIAASKDVISRPSVVVVMGHVDHGKTKILDTIRTTNITEKEAGGITQHIGAYETEKDGRKITFIDTPGHEAFTAMRSRGAKVADIAILVVAADDGVQPQTREAIDIITAAKLPFIVAINKIDKPEANLEKVKRELAEANLIPEDWGGKTICVSVSAKTGEGIESLLDTILLVSDMEAKKIVADAGGQTLGSVIESHVSKGEGVVATILVQNGTLRLNNYLKMGDVLYGRVRAMKNWKGESVTEARPSVPVKILGFKMAPEVGDVLISTDDIRGLKREVRKATPVVSQAQAVSQAQDNENKKIFNIILKTDVLGSAEAIIGSLEQFSHPKLGIKVLHNALGNINLADIERALASNAIVYGFNVKLDSSIALKAREKAVEVNIFQIIYDLLNDIKKKLESMQEIEYSKEDIGKIKILAIFKSVKEAQVIGGKIIEGKAVVGAKFDLARENEIIDSGEIKGLQAGKQEVNEAVSPNECGIRAVVGQEIKSGDILQLYKEERIEQKIKL